MKPYQSENLIKRAFKIYLWVLVRIFIQRKNEAVSLNQKVMKKEINKNKIGV